MLKFLSISFQEYRVHPNKDTWDEITIRVLSWCEFYFDASAICVVKIIFVGYITRAKSLPTMGIIKYHLLFTQLAKTSEPNLPHLERLVPVLQRWTRWYLVSFPTEQLDNDSSPNFQSRQQISQQSKSSDGVGDWKTPLQKPEDQHKERLVEAHRTWIWGRKTLGIS